MKRLFLIIGILLSGLLVIGGFSCSGTEETEEVEGPPSGWETYQNEEHGFWFYYPEHWQKNYPAGLIVSFMSPDVNEFQESVNVVVESCGDMSLDEYIAANKESLPQIIPGVITSSERDIEVQGRKGHEWIARWTNQGMNMKQKQVMFVVHGKGYVLTCSALENTYGEYSQTFSEIIDSFVIE